MRFVRFFLSLTTRRIHSKIIAKSDSTNDEGVFNDPGAGDYARNIPRAIT